MIILTAGHTGPNSGAQCAATQFDEGAENIWLRNRIAEILTNKYGLVVLMDDDTASLQLLIQSINALPCRDAQLERPNEQSEKLSTFNFQLSTYIVFLSKNTTSTASPTFDLQPSTVNTQNIKTCLLGRDFAQQKQDHYVKEKSSYVFLSKNTTSKANPTVDDIIIDIHFNAHSNPQARGCETIVADDATELELRVASRLAHATADSLEIPLRGIKSESETPHRRLAMLHLTPQSIILEVCFCTSPEDVEAYRNNREKLAADLARAIAELLHSVVSTDNCRDTACRVRKFGWRL